MSNKLDGYVGLELAGELYKFKMSIKAQRLLEQWVILDPVINALRKESNAGSFMGAIFDPATMSLAGISTIVRAALITFHNEIAERESVFLDWFDGVIDAGHSIEELINAAADALKLSQAGEDEDQKDAKKKKKSTSTG